MTRESEVEAKKPIEELNMRMKLHIFRHLFVLVACLYMAKALPQAYEQLEIYQEGPVKIIALNPPNALGNPTLFAELDTALREAEADMETRAIVITGANEGQFLLRYDVGILTNLSRMANSQPPAQPVQLEEIELTAMHQTFLFMNDMTKPVISAITGDTMGAGCELAMATDFRIMSRSKRIGQPEVLAGFIPGGGGTQRMTRLIGIPRALDIMLRGKVISAIEAETIGLVNAAVDEDKVLEEAMLLATELSQLPPTAIGLIKRALYQGIDESLEMGLKIEQKAMFEAFASEEMLQLSEQFLQSSEIDSR